MSENANIIACDMAVASRSPCLVGRLDRDSQAITEVGMSPRLLVRHVGSIAVVDFLNSQMLIEDQTVEQLGAGLQRLASAGQVRIVLNLEGVGYASSALLGHLAWLHRRVVKAQGFLRLCGLDPGLRHAMHICHLDNALEIYQNEVEALSAGNGEAC